MTDLPFHRSSLADLSRSDLAAAFNRVYQDYLLPLSMDEARMADHVRLNDGDLRLSPLWRDEAGEVAALALIGRRGPRAWIGGFGVAVPWRGNRLALPAMHAAVAAARGAGAEIVELEVLAGNDRAVRTYERAGFVHGGMLDCVAGTIPAADSSGIRPVEPAELIGPGLRRTCWQRAPESLARMTGLHAVAGDARNFLLFTRAGTDLQIRQLEAENAERAARLLAAASDGAQRAILINEPVDSPVLPLLQSLGFARTAAQHFMSARL